MTMSVGRDGGLGHGAGEPLPVSASRHAPHPYEGAVSSGPVAFTLTARRERLAALFAAAVLTLAAFALPSPAGGADADRAPARAAFKASSG
ncbi:MAG: hypothetical protein K5872_03010 [Rhizobiaceae bacterium]|nr:hypothetical protein [Rhizobiaceae bacterium]MCV0405180.1 hypothetical protein [Rhizobiaceae bacterium]